MLSQQFAPPMGRDFHQITYEIHRLPVHLTQSKLI